MSLADLQEAFKAFATKANNTEMTSTDFTRWCKDAGVISKACNSNHIDISFSKAKGKDRNLLFPKLDLLLTEMAKKYKDDIKADEAAAKEALVLKLSGASKQMHGTTKTVKTGGVEKLTDTALYTGAHKERFDADGKGKGLDGRTDRV